MEAVFSLSEDERSNYMQSLMQYFGSTYICLWSFQPSPSNNLISWGGYYQEDHDINQPTTSSGSLSRVCFNEYQRRQFSIFNNLVPGLALKTNSPYLQFDELELQNMASFDLQRQFYQEARIKEWRDRVRLVELYAPCKKIVSLETEMKALFPEDFSRQYSLQLSQASSSPSSIYISAMDTATISIHQLLQSFTLTQNTQSPNRESVDAAIKSAILSVLGLSSSSYISQRLSLRRGGAFSNYMAGLVPQLRGKSSRKSMIKRAITYYQGLSMARHELRVSSRPPSIQLDHILSERRRRKNINERLEALRALLPPGTKKDKASVLRGAKENLASLKQEVMELRERNQTLQAQLSRTRHDSHELTTNESVQVQVTNGESESTSTSQQRVIDLRVTVRSRESCNEISDMLIGILEFLKTQDIHVLSIDANSQYSDFDDSSFHCCLFRLAIDQRDEWDESAFKEAIRRVVGGIQ